MTDTEVLRIKGGKVGTDILPVIPISKGGTGATNDTDARRNLAGINFGRPLGIPLVYDFISDTGLVTEPITTDDFCLRLAPYQTVYFTHTMQEMISLTDAPCLSGYCMLSKGANDNYMQGMLWADDGTIYAYSTAKGWAKVYTDLEPVDKATLAYYASEDHSKGTIEERLTNLGYREGTIILDKALGGTIVKGTLKRQGNYVIGDIIIDYADAGYPNVSGTIYPFTLPDGFIPSNDNDTYLGSIQCYIGSSTSENNPRGVCSVNLISTTSNNVQIFNMSATSVSNIALMRLNVHLGYKAVPLS